jgi:hypothetical protein
MLINIAHTQIARALVLLPSPLAAATSVCGLKLLVYDASSYYCTRPDATSVSGLKLLVYEALYY